MRSFNRHFTIVCVGLMVTFVGENFAADPVQLTQDGRQKMSPVFRRHGQEVVYVDFADSTLFQLRRFHLESGTDERLHPDSTFAEFEPTWAFDEERYAHLKLRGTLSISIVIRDRDGAILKEILPDNGFRGYRSPAISPDHSSILFSYAEMGAQQIFTMSVNDSERRRLTDSTGLDNWPAYSPDGKRIVFGSSRDGNFEIYRMDLIGGDLKRMTDHPLQDIRPRYSPDGSQIAFTSHRDGNAEIYVMNADGQELRRLTDHPERDDYPNWHPDGRRIVFVREHEGRHDLFLVSVAPAAANVP